MASLESGDSGAGQSSTTIVSDLTVGTTSEDDDSMADTSHSSSTISISPRTVLNSLRSPILSNLSRKRSVRSNPPIGKKRSCSRSKSDPKSITPAKRAAEYPNEHFVVGYNSKLFCTACREELSLKASILKRHVQSAKHLDGKERLKRKSRSEVEIASALQAHNRQNHLQGETLPTEQQVYRVKVLTAFMRAGIPLNKMVCFREIFEENALRLTDRSHMANLIPFIVEQEKEKLKKEVLGKDVSVCFDGTTRLGEALVIVVRFLENWKLRQRLVQVKIIAKSMTGEELARELIDTLSTNYSVSSSQLLAVMRDRCSVNNVALRTLKVVYPSLVDIGCIAHTINIAGERFKIPVLNEFINIWNSLFAHSAKARLCWKNQTGLSVPTYSPTRWWSKFEVMKYVLVKFGDVEEFVRGNDEFSPATKSKLLAIVSDSSKKGQLLLELAAVVDAGEGMVKATYSLESDGLMVLQAYELVSTIMESFKTDHAPNVNAICRQLSSGHSGDNDAYQRLQSYANSCVKPGYQYLMDTFSTGALAEVLQIFKMARLFDPCKVREIAPIASSLDSLAIIPFLKPVLPGLKEELPAYLVKTDDISSSFDVLQWWEIHSTELPFWSKAASQVFLICPTSASSERVFSIMKNSFHDRQDNSLLDYIEGSLFLQYNCAT